MAVSNYDRIIAHIFHRHFTRGLSKFDFTRNEIAEAVNELGLQMPKNLGDVVYSYRFRKNLPPSIRESAKAGFEWVICLSGIGRYRFELTDNAWLLPARGRIRLKVPNSTPTLITKYAQSDEQALLALVRYNRLIDLFLQATCFSLQNHLRTQVEGLGQIEVDELYVGVDRNAAQYIIPVQAKGGSDKLGIVQIHQDIVFCKARFPDLKCRAVAAQFLDSGGVALMELNEVDGAVKIIRETHYEIVDATKISAQDLESYSVGFDN